MEKGDLLASFWNGLKRAAPILLPGFAGVWILAASRTCHATAWPVGFEHSFGGFLVLLLLLPPAAVVVGLLLQALRLVTFDLVRRLVRDEDPPEDSPHTRRYALYANLSVFWAVLFVLRHIDQAEWPWGSTASGLFVVVWFLVELGLIEAAWRAYLKALEPPPKPQQRARTRKR